MGIQARPAGFIGPMPAEPARRVRGERGKFRQGIENQYPEPIGPLENQPRSPAVPPPRRRRRQPPSPKAATAEPPVAGPPVAPPKVKAQAVAGLRKLGKLKRFGLAAAGLGAGLGIAGKLVGDYREQMIRKALLDIQRGQDDSRHREMMRQAQMSSYEDAIQRNLRTLEQSAPDLYASVAAGRKLPQGGVVIGGAPRQDLLNELGRAMADGQFSR